MAREEYTFYGEAKMKKDILAKMDAHVQMFEMVEEISFHDIEKDGDIHHVSFYLYTRHEDDALTFVRYLNYYTDIENFHGSMREDDSTYRENYFLEGGKFFKSIPDVSGSQSFEGREEDFQEFKKEILERETRDLYFSASHVEGSTLKDGLNVLKASNSYAEFSRNYATFGKKGLLDLKETAMTFGLEESSDELEEEFEYTAWVSNGEVLFEKVLYRQEYNDRHEVDIELNKYYLKELTLDEMTVSIRPFDYEEFFGTSLPKALVLQILKLNPEKIEVFLEEKWYYACDSCENRLKKEVEGCGSCSFTPFEEASPLVEWMNSSSA